MTKAPENCITPYFHVLCLLSMEKLRLTESDCNECDDFGMPPLSASAA